MKRTKNLLQVLLCCALLVLLSATATTAMAAGVSPITGVSLSGLPVPVVGERIQYVDGYDLEEDASGAHKYRVIDNQTCSWRDEEGRAINYGAQVFEAGRTYSINFNVAPKDGYAFTSEDIPVMLSNLYDHQYTGSIELYPETSVATVTFTFKLPGERTYDDIANFSFYGMRAPEDGDTVSVTNGEWAYNNSEVTDRYWTDGAGKRVEFGSKFVGGNSYFYNYEFTAFDGYKFAENISVLANNEAPTNWEYTFNDARTTLHIKIPYFIDTSDTVSSVVVDGMFVPNQTKSTRDWDSNVYLRTSSYAHYQIPLQTNGWYEVDAEYSIDTEYEVTEQAFRAGKQYKMFLIVHAKDGYKFAPPESMSFEFSGIPASTYTYTVREGGADDIIEVVVTFTAQFPSGVGENANNPAWCYSYIELKTALESDDIRYVALGNVEDMLPAIPHDEEKDPDGITTTAIVVRGHKDLNLLGNAVFRCPLTGNYDLKYYVQLLTLTDAADSSLYIHGDGSLTYEGGTLYFVNSAITVDGGHLTVDGATVRGSNGYHTGYCYGINARRGSVSIQNGATIIGEVYGGDDGICAMAVGEEGEYRSLSVSIWDGKFYVERDTGNASEDYGISVWNDCGLRIYGMTSDGIELKRYAADTLADYVMGGTAMTVNGVKTDPDTCGTTSGYVEVYQEISKVDLALNSPAAGEAPVIYPNEVYWVPEGCTVESVVWYEDGDPWNTITGAARFQAGSTYRVDIALVADNGVKFANPLASATINYKKATVSSHEGNAQKGIVLSADLGECADAISLVELTVTAPAEGNKPSYNIVCGSDAYYPVGINSDNYTDYRQWYESSDGDVWWKIDTSSKFTADYYYKLVVDIRTNNGYEFPVYDNGSSIVPGVSATVNGYYADVIKAYDQDPSRYITVEYNFGECSDSIVEKITVENVTAPVAGERPTYTYSIRGSGYQMNTAKNAYEDIYWKNPPEQWYFIKNGIGWYDLTDDDWVYEHETFIPGHEYKVYVYLVTEDGYEFAYTANYENAVTATVNGKAADVQIWDGYWASQRRVGYTFDCQQQEVSTVLIYLDAPVAGQTPEDVTPTTAYPNLYLADSTYAFGGVCWYDDEGIMLDEDDVFERGRRYKVDIKLIPAKVGDANVSKFVSPAKAYINGEEVTERFDWDAVYVSKDHNTMYVYYTFFKSAPAPEIDTTPKAFLTQPKGGEVFVGEALNVSWETTFVPTQTEIQYWDGEDWDQWVVQEPENKRDDYDFENVDAETIRFRIAAYVGNEIVATSKEFTVTWESPEYATAQWNGNTCTVTLEIFEEGVSVMVASYESGKLVKVEYLTVEDPTAILTGDNVKVFFLDDETYAPIRKMMELQR